MRGRDVAGNLDPTPASYTCTIDTSLPPPPVDCGNEVTASADADAWIDQGSEAAFDETPACADYTNWRARNTQSAPRCGLLRWGTLGPMRRLAAALLLTLLVCAGCAGDDGDSSSTAEWAGSVCTAVAAWTDEIDRITSTVSASPTVESLRGAVDDLKAATDELVREVRGLGAPDVEGAEEIEAAVDAFAETADAKNEAVDEAVQDATNESVAQALAAFGEMTSALQTMLQAFEDADASGELETALEDAPACNP